MEDTKYVVFKREEFERWITLYLRHSNIRRPMPKPVPDATVIRGQDVFAAPALHAYANAMAVALAIIKGSPTTPDELRERLTKTADYFHGRAVEAETTDYRKLPD